MENNKKSIVKRLTIYSSMVAILLMFTSRSTNSKSKDYFHVTSKISKGKIEYNSGTIYIGNKKYLDSVDKLNNNDVLVLDHRNMFDPNIVIYDSYKIINPIIKDEIITSLLMYEEAYPSNWNRTKNSLMLEWIMHNIMYWLGYNHDHTKDVDLNNADEMVYRLRK